MTENLMGSKIKSLRKMHRWTLQELATRTISSKSYIWELENEPRRHPSARKLAVIAKALGVNVIYLVDDNQTMDEVGVQYGQAALLTSKLSHLDLIRIIRIMSDWIGDYDDLSF